MDKRIAVVSANVEELKGALNDVEIRVTLIRWNGDDVGNPDDLCKIISVASKPVVFVALNRFQASIRSVVEASHLCYSDFPVPVEINRHEGDAFEHAMSITSKMCSLAPLALRACIEVTRSSEEDGFEAESRAFADLFKSRDVRRGTEAFLNKEKPQFEGN